MALAWDPSMLTLKLLVNKDNIKCLMFKKAIVEHTDPSGICDMAAAIGDLRLLIYAHEHNYPWDEWTTMCAARGGHLDCLTYAHRNGCKWSRLAICAAAWHNHTNCVDFIRDNGSYLRDSVSQFF